MSLILLTFNRICDVALGRTTESLLPLFPWELEVLKKKKSHPHVAIFSKSINIISIMPSSQYPEAKLGKTKFPSGQNTLCNQRDQKEH